MDLDRIRKDYQSKFNVKRVDVDKYRAMIRGMPVERLKEQQRKLLEQPTLQARMKEVKKDIEEDNDILPEDKNEKREENYNQYVKMTTDNNLELKLINEELDRQGVPTSGMRPKFYNNTQF
jgi:hypothetical protein